MNQKVVIVGAGPSGLSTAYFLKKRNRNLKITILEKESLIGGLGRTEDNGRIRFDMGPHYYYTTDKNVMSFFTEIIGKDGFIENYKYALISTLGKYFDYPIRLNVKSIRNLLPNLINAATAWLLRGGYRKADNLEDYFIRNYGKCLYHIFFEDYTEKVWGIHPVELPYDFLGQRIEKDGLIDILRNTFFSERRLKSVTRENLEQYFLRHFLYPHKGSGEFWEKVSHAIQDEGVNILTDVDIYRINPEQKKVEYYIDGEQNIISYDRIVLTNPLDETLKYLCDKEYLKSTFPIALRYRSLVFVNLEIKNIHIKNEDVSKVHYIYLHDKKVVSGRITFFSNWSSQMSLTQNASCCLEYYCNIDDSLLDESVEQFRDRAFADLKNGKYILEKDQIISIEVRKVPKCYPITLDKSVRERVIRAVEEKGITLIGRLGRHEYISMAKCIEEAMIFSKECEVSTNE